MLLKIDSVGRLVFRGHSAASLTVPFVAQTALLTDHGAFESPLTSPVARQVESFFGTPGPTYLTE